MSVSFSGPFTPSRPGREELIAFAQKANEIEIGGIDNIGDDMGMSLLTNTNKINISTRREDGRGSTITLDNGGSSGGNFSDNLEFVNLDSMDSGNGLGGPAQTIELPNFASSSDSFSKPQSQPMNFDNNSGTVTFQQDSENGSSLAKKPQLTPEQEAKEKNSYLTRLQRLSTKGMGGQRMTMANSLDEIKEEFSRVVDGRNLESSLKFQRNAMMTFATGLEFLNQRFNPFEVNLEGWSESVHENVDDYDEIFEELYDKYKDAGKMPPEVRLVMTLGTSAAMFHITNTYFKSKMPGMDDILRNNPELARQFATAAANQVGSGFGNFVGAAMNGGSPGQQRAREQQQQSQSMPFNMSSRMPQSQSQSQGQGQSQDDGGNRTATARREMRGPTGVDDILQAFEQERMNQSNSPQIPIDVRVAPIFPPGDNELPYSIGLGSLRDGVGGDSDPLREVSTILDEMQSVASTTMTMDENKKRRGRKSTSTIPEGRSLTLNV
jgi:hypothetical protein